MTGSAEVALQSPVLRQGPSRYSIRNNWGTCGCRDFKQELASCPWNRPCRVILRMSSMAHTADGLSTMLLMMVFRNYSYSYPTCVPLAACYGIIKRCALQRSFTETQESTLTSSDTPLELAQTSERRVQSSRGLQSHFIFGLTWWSDFPKERGTVRIQCPSADWTSRTRITRERQRDE